MSVDYTKVFTIIGNPIARNNDYFAFLSTFDTDQTATESLLDAQNEVRLVDGLEDVYSSLRDDVVGWTSLFIDRVAGVLTDYELVTSQFTFGNTPGVQEVLKRLIKDMNDETKLFVPSVSTVGSITKDTTNTTAGELVIKTKLDGVSPPLDGAIANPEYFGLTTQLVPDAETITLTCVSDSENGAQRGSERFEITGIGPKSSPYSILGEHIGNAGQIVVADNGVSSFLSNASFDDWSGSPETPTGWTFADEADAVSPTDFTKNSGLTVSGTGYALELIGHDKSFDMIMPLPASTFQRLGSYIVSVWARKKTDAGTDMSLTLSVSSSSSLGDLTINPSTTDWRLFSMQILVPIEIGDEFFLEISGSLVTGNDNLLLDQIVITPVTYLAGVGIAVFGGPEKFLIGDSFTFDLSNGNEGVFQTFFRKAFAVQLPTDASETIDDALVT